MDKKQELIEIKAQIFDIENEQKGLRTRIDKLEEIRQSLYLRLLELMKEDKNDTSGSSE